MTINQAQGIDFDRALERRGSDSHKWNRYSNQGHDVIGAWVADMDFACAPAILEAISARVEEGVFGYSDSPPELEQTVLARLKHLYRWDVDPEWLVTLPGVVPGLYTAAQLTGSKGDRILTQNPNYYHFFGAASYAQRELALVDSVLDGGRWQLDFDAMAHHAAGAGSFLLCNPYNPVGRVLSRPELEHIAQICLANDMLICSDEIHADLVLDTDKAHIPIASLGPEVEQKSISLISPSKAFNLPGIGGFALAIIPNPRLRNKFTQLAHGIVSHPGALAYAGALAAYRDGEPWLLALQQYLRGNRDLLQREIASINGLSTTHVEATFLSWINVAGLGLENPQEHFLSHGVALSAGEQLGDSDYLRLNFACPRATLKEIIQRIRRGVEAAPAQG